MRINQILIAVTLVSISLVSCKKSKSFQTISNEDQTNNCLILKEIVEQNEINKVILIRPFGNLYDTTYYNLNTIDDLYGERLFTLGNEKVQCKDIDSIVSIDLHSLTIKSNVSGYDNSGPFTQEYVSNYWESGNGFLLNKRLPSFKGYSYGGNYLDLDSIVFNSEKTLIHFGWLNCKGCMEEQNEISTLIKKMPEIKFVNMTIDKPEKLDKYLIDKGEYFETQPPFNRISSKMNKPLLYDEKKNLFEYFHLKGLFPVNFLVDNSGKIEKIGSLIEVIESDDNIEIFRIN